MKIADSLNIRSIDKIAIEKYGIPGLSLMENAGKGVADIALRELGGASIGAKAVVFAGKGNNGGDGYVAARLLRDAGVKVIVFSLCKTGELKGDAAANASSWMKMGGKVIEILTSEAAQAARRTVEEASIVIDAIFGTGLAKVVKGVHADAIRLINGAAKNVLSIDIPSGVNATTGAILGAAVKAGVTATMAMPKLGLFLSPGGPLSGRVEVVDIGVPKEVVEDPSIKWNLL